MGGSKLLKFVVEFSEFCVWFVGRAVPKAEEKWTGVGVDGEPKSFGVGCCCVVGGGWTVYMLEGNDTAVVGASGFRSVVGSVTSCYLLVVWDVKVGSC